MSVQLFESEILNVSLTSVVCEDGEIYFKAKDIATALGYADSDDAIRRHVRGEDKFEWCVIRSDPGESPGLADMHPKTKFLTESGVYQLIFNSKLPSAKNFKRWVFSEVLPSIRKTGSYTLKDPIEKLSSITLEDLSAYDWDRRKEYKTILKSQGNILKNPVKAESGQRGGLKAHENRRKLVEFKNMFIGLYETFGSDE